MRFKLYTLLVVVGLLFAGSVFALPLIQYFNTDVQFKKGVIDSYGSTGTPGQLWSSTGTSTKWVSTSTVFAEVDPIWNAFLLDPVFTNLTSTNFFATSGVFNTLTLNSSTPLYLIASSTGILDVAFDNAGYGRVHSGLDFRGITGNRNFTFPDLDGIFAFTDYQGQHFTGYQYFDQGASFSGSGQETAVDITQGNIHFAGGARIDEAEAGKIGFTSGAGTGYPDYIYAKHDVGSLTASRNFLYPDQDGTFAMVNDLTLYLPLAGGTLSGGLIFTTASGTSVTSTNAYLSSLTFLTASGTSITTTNLNASLGQITQLGVNSSSPIAQLSVKGVAGTNPLEISSSSGASLFHINQDTTVGVNTTSKAYTMTIEQKDISKPVLLVKGDTLGLQNLLELKGYGGQLVSINSAGSYIGPFMADSGLSVALSILSPPNRRLGFNFGSSAGVYWGNTTLYNAAKDVGISRVASGIIGVGDSTVNAYNGTLALGKLGINSSTPTAQLTIKGSTSTNPINITSSSGASFMYMDSRGYIGLNNSAPAYILDVNGATNFTGNLSVGSGYIYGVGAGISVYSQNDLSVRGSLLKDNGAVLSITGGTSGYTNIVSKLGINSSTPIYNLSVSGTVGVVGMTTNIVGNGVCRTATGEITDAGAAACIPSALKYKTNVSLYKKSATQLFTDLFNAGAVNNYELKSNLGNFRKGLIADVVEKVDPGLVGYSEDGTVNTLHFEDITGLSVQAIAELNARIIKLEKKVKQLEKNNLLK